LYYTASGIITPIQVVHRVAPWHEPFPARSALPASIIQVIQSITLQATEK